MMTNAITQDADVATPAAGQVPTVPNNASEGNANNGASNQQQQQVLARPIYQSTFFNGTLPAPTGELAQFINLPQGPIRGMVHLP